MEDLTLIPHRNLLLKLVLPLPLLSSAVATFTLKTNNKNQVCINGESCKLRNSLPKGWATLFSLKMVNLPGAHMFHTAVTRVSEQVCAVRQKGLESTSTCDMESHGHNVYFNTTLDYLGFDINYELWIITYERLGMLGIFRGECVCVCLHMGCRICL